MQTAGSTAGAESRGEGSHRAEGSSRAERAVSLESAASASLPATAIPKGEHCWSACPCIVDTFAGCILHKYAGCIDERVAGCVVDVLASVLDDGFFVKNRYRKEPHLVYLTPQAVLGLFTHQCTE